MRFSITEPTRFELRGNIYLEYQGNIEAILVSEGSVCFRPVGDEALATASHSITSYDAGPGLISNNCIEAASSLLPGEYVLEMLLKTSGHTWQWGDKVIARAELELLFEPIVEFEMWSTPASGAIDARDDQSPSTGEPAGLDTIRLHFTDAARDSATGDHITPDTFELVDSDGDAPEIVSVESVPCEANTYDLLLSRPLDPGEWTTISANVTSRIGEPLNTEAATVSIGFLPGDVNADLTSTPADILALIDGLNGISILPIERSDIDRGGEAAPSDILRLIDLLNGVNTSRVWLDQTLPPPK